MKFPSPHSGILFYYVQEAQERKQILDVSVPSFGDSFFITCV